MRFPCWDFVVPALVVEPALRVFRARRVWLGKHLGVALGAKDQIGETGFRDRYRERALGGWLGDLVREVLPPLLEMRLGRGVERRALARARWWFS